MMTALQEKLVQSGPGRLGDPVARMRQLASNVMWTEALGKAHNPIATFNDGGDAANAAPPFYCVHSLSGKATDYGQLALMMGPGQPFYGLQIPVSNRTPDFGGLGAISIVSVARYYADALERFQPTGPLALGGWSVGAVVALELARQLRARGRTVTLLVAFDLAPWNIEWSPRSLRYRLALARNFLPWLRAHRLVRQSSWRVLCDAMLVKLGRRAPQIKQVETLGADIAVTDLVDPARYPPAHAALMPRLLDATVQYRPEFYDGPVQVYVAGTQVPLNHLPRLKGAWRRIAPASRVCVVRGTHRSMIEERDGQALARDLVQALARAAEACG